MFIEIRLTPWRMRSGQPGRIANDGVRGARREHEASEARVVSGASPDSEPWRRRTGQTGGVATAWVTLGEARDERGDRAPEGTELMKHVPATEVTGETRAKPPTRRALAKQQTRAKVLAAARKLFSEKGYEGATIRDIAAEAGMSTGAVFANFSDKSDLFCAIMITDLTAQAAQIREALSKARGVEDALLRIFTAGYAFYKDQMPLARAAMSVSWAPDDGEMLRKLVPFNEIEELMLAELTAAVERGELGQEAEVKLRAQMLYDAYMSNFRHAIFRGWGLDALQARARDQIRVILSGARRG